MALHSHCALVFVGGKTIRKSIKMWIKRKKKIREIGIVRFFIRNLPLLGFKLFQIMFAASYNSPVCRQLWWEFRLILLNFNSEHVYKSICSKVAIFFRGIFKGRIQHFNLGNRVCGRSFCFRAPFEWYVSDGTFSTAK